MKNNKTIDSKLLSKINFNANDRETKFRKLSNIRVANLLDNFRLVGNLANKRYYEYSDQQKNDILKAISQEYKSMRAAWEKAGKKKELIKKKGFWDRIKEEN